MRTIAGDRRRRTFQLLPQVGRDTVQVPDDDEPIYVDQMGTEWWCDGRIWNYWRDDRAWAPAPGATPINLIVSEDTVP